MQIKNMFRDDINRKINGVIQVEQDKTDVVEQEVKEYVVTNELKKHFTNFFNVYSEGFETGSLRSSGRLFVRTIWLYSIWMALDGVIPNLDRMLSAFSFNSVSIRA